MKIVLKISTTRLIIAHKVLIISFKHGNQKNTWASRFFYDVYKCCLKARIFVWRNITEFNSIIYNNWMTKAWVDVTLPSGARIYDKTYLYLWVHLTKSFRSFHNFWQFFLFEYLYSAWRNIKLKMIQVNYKLLWKTETHHQVWLPQISG